MEILRKVSLFGYKMEKGCVECDRCREACHLDTRPDEANCTNCGECRTRCPVDAVAFGIRFEKEDGSQKRLPL